MTNLSGMPNAFIYQCFFFHAGCQMISWNQLRRCRVVTWLISSDCSNMIRSVLIWSAHTLFCLNSAWFSRSLESTAAPSRCRIITLIGASFLYNQHKYSVFPFGSFTRYPFLKVSSSMMVLPLSPKYYRRSHIRSLPPFLCLLWGPVAGT